MQTSKSNVSYRCSSRYFCYLSFGAFNGKSRNIYLAILYPVLLNGLIICLELHFVLVYPPLSSIFYVALGEFTVLIFGLLIFKTLIRKQGFRDLIEAEQNIG